MPWALFELCNFLSQKRGTCMHAKNIRDPWKQCLTAWHAMKQNEYTRKYSYKTHWKEKRCKLLRKRVASGISNSPWTFSKPHASACQSFPEHFNAPWLINRYASFWRSDSCRSKLTMRTEFPSLDFGQVWFLCQQFQLLTRNYLIKYNLRGFMRSW